MPFTDPEERKRYHRAWYRRNRDQVIARTRDWKRNHPDEHTEQIRSYRTSHPEKYEAHKAVKRALRSGELVRQPCEVCGAKAEAHHDDYSKPLDVRWLCREHHRRVHGFH